jgi:hypothetical protein
MSWRNFGVFDIMDMQAYYTSKVFLSSAEFCITNIEVSLLVLWGNIKIFSIFHNTFNEGKSWL